MCIIANQKHIINIIQKDIIHIWFPSEYFLLFGPASFFFSSDHSFDFLFKYKKTSLLKTSFLWSILLSKTPDYEKMSE